MSENYNGAQNLERGMTSEFHAISKVAAEIAESHGSLPNHVSDPSLLETEIEALSTHPELITGIPAGITESAERKGNKELFMPNRTEVFIQNELEPIKTVTMPMQDGIEREVDVLAVIRPQNKPHRYEIVSDGDGGYGLVLNGLDGPVKGITLHEGAGFMNLNDEIVAVSHNPESGNTWKLSYHNEQNRHGNARLEVASSTEQGKVMKSAIEKEQQAERIKKRLKRGIGAAALFATLTSGGAIDIAADHIVDTDSVVGQSIEEISESRMTLGDSLDGIKISDFTHPDEVLSDMNGPIEAIESSREAIEQTMKDLDSHNYQAIQQRAERYIESHPGELLAATEADRLLDTIRTANNKEQIESSLQEIAAFYGLNFEASEKLSLEQLQNAAIGISEGLSVVPKSLLNEAALTNIRIDTPAEIDEHFGGHDAEMVGGYYSSNNRTLVMRGMTDVTAFNMRANTTPGVQEGNTIKAMFMHELAHALNAGNSDIGSGDHDRSSGRNALAYGIDFISGGLSNYPQAISTYSRDNIRESVAENLSGIMSDRTDGIPHPDDARRFSSPAGQTMIQNLASLEAFQPGLADYFVSINPNLMTRNNPLATR